MLGWRNAKCVCSASPVAGSSINVSFLVFFEYSRIVHFLSFKSLTDDVLYWNFVVHGILVDCWKRIVDDQLVNDCCTLMNMSDRERFNVKKREEFSKRMYDRLSQHNKLELILKEAQVGGDFHI